MAYRKEVYRCCAEQVQSIDEERYSTLCGMKSLVKTETSEQIEKDLGRTYGSAKRPPNFEAKLRSILSAYALHDPVTFIRLT